MNRAAPARMCTLLLAIAAAVVLSARPADARSGVLATPGAAQEAAAPTVARVDWSDVGEYRKAMKSGFEDDVKRFVNANRYVIVAALTINDKAIIRGAERVRFTNHTNVPLADIVFRLYPNTPVLGARMDVTGVTADGLAVSPVFSDLNSVMTLPLAAPLGEGASVEMTMAFDVVMTPGVSVSYGRFGYEHDVVSATAWYPTLSVYEDGRGWWKAMPSPEGDPAFTETGLYDVRLTAPATMAVAMSGTEIDSTTNADHTITHHDVTGPMRDHAFEASTRYAVVSGTRDGVHLNVWHYKDQNDARMDATADVLTYAGDALHAYDDSFGIFPFKEFDVVENPTPTGVEYPGLVQISEHEWTKDSGSLEITVAHETGHQWFYSLVGNDQVNHPWLDEGLTTYTEFVYMRAVHPQDADRYVAETDSIYRGYITHGGEDTPVDGAVGQFSSQAYGMIVYMKTAVFLVHLETEIGRETVVRALAAYLHQYEYGVATPKDLEQVFDDVSGRDLGAEFRQWVGPDA